jgi:hypothetical protein
MDVIRPYRIILVMCNNLLTYNAREVELSTFPAQAANFIARL